MKTLFLTIPLLFLVSCTKEINRSDLVFNDEDCLFYLKGSTTPFTGKVLDREVEDGDEWYSERYSKDGKQSGEEKLYKNGNLVFLTTNEDGVYHGEVIWFDTYGWDDDLGENSLYTEGDIDIKSFWIKGNVVGDVELHYPDGTIEMKKPEEVTNFPVNLIFKSDC